MAPISMILATISIGILLLSATYFAFKLSTYKT